MKHDNIELPENYSQVCVLEGVILEESEIPVFEKWIYDETGARVKYLETIITSPDTGDSNTGGRHDIIFTIHNEDISSFAVKRFNYGIRWIEDVLSDFNYRHKIYPERIFKYISWDANASLNSALNEGINIIS